MLKLLSLVHEYLSHALADIVSRLLLDAATYRPVLLAGWLYDSTLRWCHLTQHPLQSSEPLACIANPTFG